jgi:hypothetical protein
VPKRKRVQREHTEDWQMIQQYTLWPERTAYELLRPVVLFGDPATKRAEETGEPRTSQERKADVFDEQGMRAWSASLLPGRENSHRKRRGACHRICAS